MISPKIQVVKLRDGSIQIKRTKSRNSKNDVTTVEMRFLDEDKQEVLIVGLSELERDKFIHTLSGI